MKPWLCVLLPTLDGAEFLSDALSSIERENDPGIHCIVVDGGSKDATYSTVETFAKRIPLTLLQRADSGGWVWSTNLALSLAEAPYCCLLHQDDRWAPGRAAAMKRVLAEDPDLALVAHSVRYIDAVGTDVGRLSCPWRPWPARLESNETVPRLLVQNFIAAPGAVFRTDLAKACGGLDESLWYTADWDFWLKLAGSGTVAYVPHDFAMFRLHSGSQTARGSSKPAEFRDQLEVVVERHLARARQVAPAVVKAARLSARVNAALAYESHGGAADWGSITAQALRAGPNAFLRFWRDSRVASRVISRLRARRARGGGVLRDAFHRHRLLRFLAVGAMNTALTYFVYAALLFLGAGVRWSSLISLITGILIGFLAQGKIVFLGFGMWSFVKFLVVWAVLYHVFIGLVFITEHLGLNNYIGGAISTPVIAFLSYLLQSRFVFSSASSPASRRS